MPRFEPFRALRYATGVDLRAVLAPPYDVLSPDDVAELAAGDEHNIVRVDVPAPGGYQEAADLLRQWIAEGVLVRDDQLTLTIYRMSFTDAAGTSRQINGVLGGLEVVDEGAGGVLAHERTTPRATSDRLDLLRATGVQTSPVWGLSLASGLTDALSEPGEALGSVLVDGVRHSVERLTDPARIGAIQRILAEDDVLLADGHHRYSVSRTYRDERRATTGRRDTPAEYTLAFVNELIADQLSIEAIHRLYTGVTSDALMASLASSFDIEPLEDALGPDTLAQMVELGRLVLVTAHDHSGRCPTQITGIHGHWLIPKPGAFDQLRALDGAWLEQALADSPAQVDYQHGLSGVLDAVGTGRAVAGVLIRPTSLTEITRTARHGLLMPPKSTFFTPKLRTGFVLRSAVEE